MHPAPRRQGRRIHAGSVRCDSRPCRSILSPPSPESRKATSCSSPAFPAGPWGTNCYVVAAGPRRGVRRDRPGLGRCLRRRRRGARAPAATGRRAAHARTPRPHVVGGAGRGRLRRHGLHPPGGPHLLTDPGAGISPETAAMMGMLGGRPPSPSRTTWRELADGITLALAGLDFVGRPHAWAHRGVGDVPAAVQRTRGRARGDVLRRPAVRGLDRPDRPTGGDHPTMLRSLADKVLPLDDGIVVLPGHGSRPPSVASAPPTPSCRTCRRRDTANPQGSAHEQTHSVERVPRVPAQPSARRAGRDRHGCARPSSCTASPPSRPATSSRWTGCSARARPTRRSTSCAGSRPTTPTPSAAPGSGCTSTSPCRWRATCSRTPGQARVPVPALPDPEGAGGASGRRRGVTASSPKPTSTSSGDDELRFDPTSRWREVMAEAWSAAGATADAARQQPQADRGLLPRAGARRRPGAA